MKKSIKIGKQTRALVAAQEIRANEETGTLTFPFSSELPVRRWFGREILSHDAECVDLSRFHNRAQVLFNHDWDKYVGVIERAWIGPDKRGYVEIKFSENALAQEVKRDVENGTLTNVSFGYQIEKMLLTEKSEEEGDEYTATKWLPYEVSFVTVPADTSVGVGRSEEGNEVLEVPILNADTESEKEVRAMAEPQVDVQAEIQKAQKAERSRAESISALGEKFGQHDLARQLVAEGVSLDNARGVFLEKMGAVQKPLDQRANDIDLTEKEKRSYSLVKAIRAAATGNWKDAGFEREISETIAKRSGKETAGFYLPMNITLDQSQVERAAYATSVPTAAGNLVATNLLAGSFIDILRAKAMVVQMGAQMLSGLVGNVAIPRQSGVTQAYWITEGASITEDESMSFDLVSLAPKTIAARSQVTRQMMQQSTPDIEALIRNDLARVLALGIDKAAIHGTGASGQPRGILNQSGIGAVVGGTNGAQITLDHLIDLETAVAVGNADFGSLGYMSNAKVVGALKKLKSTTGQYLWTNAPGGGRSATPGEINGYVMGRTNQVASNLTKGTSSGVASAVLFGNWSDLLIGEWGVLEILANPFGAGFNAGSVDVRAMQTVDTAVRHAESFSAMTDALT